MLTKEDNNKITANIINDGSLIPAADDIVDFIPLTCDTIGELIRLSRCYPYHLSCYSPGYLLMWNEYFNAAYALAGGCVIIKVKTGKKEKFFFPYPCADTNDADISAALYAIERYSAKKSIPLLFYTVPRHMLPEIALRYNVFKVAVNRNSSDYIYNAEDMRSFAGRKFSGQRNHLNKFKKLYPGAVFRRLSKTDEDKAKLERFWERFESGFDSSLFSARIELKKAREVLELPCTASDYKACVELDGEIISFCYGERVGDMLIIHIEKSLEGYPGVYQFMVSSFATEFSGGLSLVNREDDAGSRGLRISKTQYHPVKIEESIAVEIHSELHSLRKPPEIKTENLIIGLLEERDIVPHRRLCLDDEINKYWGYDYRGDIVGELTDDYFFRDAMKDYKLSVSVTLAVRRDDEFIGEAVLNEFDYRGGANVGIRLLPEYTGRGYGREAFAALCKFALYNVGLSYVTAYCMRENIASFKMLSSVMAKTGEDEKYYYFRTAT